MHNAYIDRPACLDLLGDVAGQHVLDAACGPGLHTEELTRRGAKVRAVDQSPAMVEITRSRTADVDVRVHDSADPLDWLPNDSVDAVLIALALEYVDDRVAALRDRTTSRAASGGPRRGSAPRGPHPTPPRAQ